MELKKIDSDMMLLPLSITLRISPFENDKIFKEVSLTILHEEYQNQSKLKYSAGLWEQ